MEFNCEGQNEGNNGGTIMYNYGLDYRELCGQFLVLTYCALMCEGRRSSYKGQKSQDQGRNGENGGEIEGNGGGVRVSSFELYWILICITYQKWMRYI